MKMGEKTESKRVQILHNRTNESNAEDQTIRPQTLTCFTVFVTTTLYATTYTITKQYICNSIEHIQYASLLVLLHELNTEYTYIVHSDKVPIHIHLYYIIHSYERSPSTCLLLLLNGKEDCKCKFEVLRESASLELVFLSQFFIHFGISIIFAPWKCGIHRQ